MILVNKHSQNLNISQQCALLGVSRGSYYYAPKPINPYTLELMDLIDEIYTERPFYGSPRITATLKKKGYYVNIKRIKRLMGIMAISAIYPGPNLSKANHEHKIYPYLLKGLDIKSINQVWSTDITYIRVKHGFLYLTAVIDWYSRYVLSWEVSNTLDSYFCKTALLTALNTGTPEIFNTDQGVQFTSNQFTDTLLKHNIRISMDSKGRALDNIFVERLWRSVKYEEVYLNNYDTVPELVKGLDKYFQFYNNERVHQSLNYNTPAEVHYNNIRR